MDISKQVQAIRSFNRFYVDIIGLLNNHILDSRFSLSEARVIYEIYKMDDCTARKIRNIIHIDEGYLSRMIKRFEEKGLLKRTQMKSDKRKYLIELTSKGKALGAIFDERSQNQVSAIIAHLSIDELNQLTYYMQEIQQLLLKKDQ